VNTLIAQGQSPYAQARYMAITQLAVFEAVNAITGEYQPYLGTVVAPAGASPDAAAAAAAYAVLKNYFPAAATLDPAYAASLAAIPNGPAKDSGIATGQAAAAKMIASRAADGSSPPQFSVPASTDPGVWQLTPSCPAAGGVNLQWQNVTPFGVPSAPGSRAWIDQFAPAPPPALTSLRYTRDYDEVMRVGSVSSDLTQRPQDRADVARFLRGVDAELRVQPGGAADRRCEGATHCRRTRVLSLCSAWPPATVSSRRSGRSTSYNFWRPETAIHEGSVDGNAQTDGDITFVPYIITPCFPSYPSNHGSASNGAAEILRRAYGAGGHAITMANPAVPGITFQYTRFKEITDDISDARVYGGIISGSIRRPAPIWDGPSRRTYMSTTFAARSIPISDDRRTNGAVRLNRAVRFQNARRSCPGARFCVCRRASLGFAGWTVSSGPSQVLQDMLTGIDRSHWSRSRPCFDRLASGCTLFSSVGASTIDGSSAISTACCSSWPICATRRTLHLLQRGGLGLTNEHEVECGVYLTPPLRLIDATQPTTRRPGTRVSNQIDDDVRVLEMCYQSDERGRFVHPSIDGRREHRNRTRRRDRESLDSPTVPV
jgi:hypothetical protein